MGNFSFPIFCNFTFQTGILHKIPESQNVRTMKHILLTSALSLIALLRLLFHHGRTGKRMGVCEI